MGILDIIFPKTCLGCGREGQYICSQCASVCRLSKQFCPYCYKPSIDGVTHAKCHRKTGLDGLTSVWKYEGIIKKALLALKYKYATEVGRELTSHLIDSFHNGGNLLPEASLMSPVPLYWYRKNNRGFNQSEFVGKSVADALDVKFIPDFLIRKSPTIPQVQLKGKERRQNLRGVFAINPHYNLPTSPYPLILFDDVFTTGSTLKECAKAAKRAGVSKVWGLTIAG
jgi:competence protein ComFC